ncbi:methyltransferase domain-containing protein [Candidatus Pelagibacter sp.]|jgi:SAM-dependent methyltransferase|nr:methyltransferase domain-containing protein [Candidatus Pelagibacter sp.]
MIKKFLDLGYQPLANSYVLKKNLKYKEKKFKLEVGFDNKNFLVSILKTVSKEMMFNKDYPYKSSESNTMKSSFKDLSKKIKKRFNPKFIIEIGSNDGAFIKNFNRKNVVGVEPCKNLAQITRQKKYTTYSEYWSQKLSKKITKNKKADLIYSANTLSHIENFNEIFKAINNALSHRGILILEDPSLLKCLQNVAYDQFYCEHIYVFSTLALREILKNYKLEIFDIENTKTHGGSNRYFIKKSNNNFYKINDNVKNEIKKELRFGLNKFSTYQKFERKVKTSKKKLLKIFNELNKKNLKVIGYGATAKSCTVLNYCGLGIKNIKYFFDTTSYKINKYLPGSKILIRKYKKLDFNEVDLVYLGAWNFKEEIFKKEQSFIKKGGRFITHVPYPKII